ncbi:MAG TPA: hypothetical protein VMA72_09350 [Streptosporangiaceae bacterium]|nr:hypothetical protein [Streptosporangiaceae bacterium]
MTANGSDRDGTAGTPESNESPQAGSASSAWDQGGLTPGSLVPGMEVRSPALDYMLGKQQRRVRHVAVIAASVLAIGVVAGVVAVAATNGGKNAGSAKLTAAQIVQQAARQQRNVNSETATISEHLSGQVNTTISGSVELQRKPLIMAMNLTAGSTSQPVRVRGIVTSSAMYLKLAGTAGLPNELATKWLKIPLTGLKKSSQFGALQQELQDDNPNSQLAGLIAASHLRVVGTQVVGGVTTTKYDGSFMPAAAVKALPAAQRSVLEPGLKLLKGDVAFSVWIDSSHHVRKFSETESTGDVTIVVECTYSSFNQPVKITLPPSRQVYTPPASVLNE